MQKSRLVSYIVDTVRVSSPNGGFVKRMGNRWYAVSDRHAKEKTGQTMRDLLHTKYSSSTKAKARARRQLRASHSSAETKVVGRKTSHIMPQASPVSSWHPLHARSTSAIVGADVSSGVHYNTLGTNRSTHRRRAKYGDTPTDAYILHRYHDEESHSTAGHFDTADDVSLGMEDLEPLKLEESNSDLSLGDSASTVNTSVTDESFSHAVDILMDWIHLQPGH